jgi:hypothetical protein
MRHARSAGPEVGPRSVAWLARPAGWWSLPVRLAGVVRRRRAMVPAPATYLMAAVAGAGGPPDRPPDPPWSPVTISVNGRPVGFDLLGEGRHWVAVGELEGQLLVLQARDLTPEEVELVRVTDVAPYVEGTRQLD